MNINVDRLCKLAGLANNSSNSSRLMRESVYHEGEMPEGEMPEGELEEGELEEGEMPEGEMSEEEPDMEEMIEVDETMLVQELRRAKRLMNESKRRQKRRKENLLEAELKTIIESEVENIMKDLNLNSGWVYGKRKPRASKKGYTHQGSYLKGIGFK